MPRIHALQLAAALVVVTSTGVLVPLAAHGAPRQMSVCVTKFEFVQVHTSAGLRYQVLATFSGHPTYTFLSFTTNGPTLQGTGQMTYEAFTRWRDFYDIIRTAATSKVKLTVAYDDATYLIGGLAAQFDQAC